MSLVGRSYNCLVLFKRLNMKIHFLLSFTDGMKQLVEEELRQEKRMREYEQCRVEMTNSLLIRYVS